MDEANVVQAEVAAGAELGTVIANRDVPDYGSVWTVSKTFSSSATCPVPSVPFFEALSCPARPGKDRLDVRARDKSPWSAGRPVGK